MMRLSKEQEQVFRKTLEASQEEMNMRYVTSIERMGLERGLEQGLQQGMRQGQAKILASLLMHRFGEVPPWAQAKLDSGSDEQMEAWSKALLSAATVAEVFATGSQ